MNTLFNQQDIADVIKRIGNLTPAYQRHWGKMNAVQMLAHCNVSMETAIGKNFIKRVFIGRIIGTLMKSTALSEKPFGKNSPTDKSYVYTDKQDLDFEVEKSRLKQLVTEFCEGGAAKCTTQAHPFFGKFTSEQWGIFQWKHLDHHLRQFGV